MDFLSGKWTGETKTWFDPSAKPELGTLTTEFKKVHGGLFVEEAYEGTVGNKPHEGRRIFGRDSRTKEATCYWMDTFHTGATAMVCRGAENPEKVSVEGHYYGGEEKWGWRIEFRLLSPTQLEMKHYNIWPTGKVDLAVESLLTRVSV